MKYTVCLKDYGPITFFATEVYIDDFGALNFSFDDMTTDDSSYIVGQVAPGAWLYWAVESVY